MTPKPITTPAELSKRLQVSRQLVAYHLRQPDCPQLKADGSFDLAAWRTYLAGKVRVTALFSKKDRTELARLKVQLLREQVRRLQEENNLKAGRTHDSATCDVRKGHALQILFSQLDRTFGHDLIPALKRCATEPEIQKLMLDRIEVFRANLIRRLEGLDATPDAKL